MEVEIVDYKADSWVNRRIALVQCLGLSFTWVRILTI